MKAADLVPGNAYTLGYGTVAMLTSVTPADARFHWTEGGGTPGGIRLEVGAFRLIRHAGWRDPRDEFHGLRIGHTVHRGRGRVVWTVIGLALVDGRPMVSLNTPGDGSPQSASAYGDDIMKLTRVKDGL